MRMCAWEIEWLEQMLDYVKASELAKARYILRKKGYTLKKIAANTQVSTQAISQAVNHVERQMGRIVRIEFIVGEEAPFPRFRDLIESGELCPTSTSTDATSAE